MAKIKVRSKDSEVEIDSRDFYVDNQTVGEVIDLVATHLPASGSSSAYSRTDPLAGLEEAEVHESEFSNPVPVRRSEIRSRISALKKSGFFESPRTSSETVAQMREHGWVANLLDVSKELASMSIERAIKIDSRNRRNYYTMPVPLSH